MNENRTLNSCKSIRYWFVSFFFLLNYLLCKNYYILKMGLVRLTFSSHEDLLLSLFIEANLQRRREEKKEIIVISRTYITYAIAIEIERNWTMICRTCFIMIVSFLSLFLMIVKRSLIDWKTMRKNHRMISQRLIFETMDIIDQCLHAMTTTRHLLVL